MGGVQLDHVEAGRRCPLGRLDEGRRDPVHVGPVHGARRLIFGRPGQSRGSEQVPVAVVQRRVHALPAALGGALRPGVAQLDCDPARGVAVHEVDDALPGADVLVLVQAGAARRDPAVAHDVGHLGIEQARPALGPGAVVHQVEVVGRAVVAAVHGHGRDHDPVRERHVAQAERREHGPQRRVIGAAVGARRDPALDALDPVPVAQAQVLVADPLAAGEQGVGELQGFEIDVARHALEPLGRVARGALQLQDLELAGLLIGLERRAPVALGVQGVGQVDGVLESQLGARADRIMRRVRGIAQEHDLAVVPGLALDAREVQPGRAAQVRGVAQQRLAVQVSGEQVLADGDAGVPVRRVQSEAAPGRLRAFDDEGRGVRVEAVGVGPDPAVPGLFEDEGEGVEGAPGAEPDELVPAQVDLGREGRGVTLPDLAVDAVGGDDQIGVIVGLQAVDLGLEAELDAERPRAGLQELEQAPARDAAEAVAARGHHPALDVHVDVVPMSEAVEDLGGADRVVRAQVVHGLVGEHDAPAEGVVGPVALHDRDLVGGIAQLHGDREVQPRRPAADANDPHRWISRVIRVPRSAGFPRIGRNREPALQPLVQYGFFG